MAVLDFRRHETPSIPSPYWEYPSLCQRQERQSPCPAGQATLGVNSDYSAFCIEGTPGCKYYEAAAYAAYCNRLCFVNFSVLFLRKVSCSLNWRQVPMFVTNSSSPVECGQNYPYGSRGYAELWSVLGVALGWLQEREKATVSESWSILDLIHFMCLICFLFTLVSAVCLPCTCYVSAAIDVFINLYYLFDLWLRCHSTAIHCEAKKVAPQRFCALLIPGLRVWGVPVDSVDCS